MVICVALFSAFLTVVVALEKDSSYKESTAYDYHSRIGIPIAAKIQEYEENQMTFRIVGGRTARSKTFPYHAGLVTTLENSHRFSICGACLISKTRLVTAAHCWLDGRTQAEQFEVVLGTDYLFKGGVRIETKDVVVHENFDPIDNINDIAIIRIPQINYTHTISNIALPGRTFVKESFANEWAWATGFGKTSGREVLSKPKMFLRQIKLRVISNSECQAAYSSIKASHLCTSGVGGIGTCSGDSGGPLVLKWNGERILIGITTFGASDCENQFPSAYARITSYLDWISQYL